mgnify:FL=1
MTTAKKRANGEGSLRKRSDGRWEGRYTAGRNPETGKAIYKNVLAKTQKECKEKLAQAIEKNGMIDVSRSGKYTVAEWVRLWFETYSKPSIREQTAYYYSNYIEKHIVPGIGDIRLDKLTTIQIQQFYNKLKTSGRIQRYEHIELKDRGLSNRFIHGIHGVLRSALDQAVKEKLITDNPAEGCKLPKIEKKEMKVLLPEQIGAYLQEANRRGLLPAYYLELTSGLRRGELLALLWTDLDVENMTISVTKQVNRVNGQLKVSQPKTSNSVRTIPIPKQAVDLLIQEHEKHPDSPYMFPSPKTGTMYDPDSFRHTHEKILAAAGIEHIRFHDLRHTFATLSLQHGVDVKTLSNTLGHYSAGFTLDTYTHATQRMKREAAETIGSVIDQVM